MNLNLNKMPRPARDVKKCSMKLLKRDGSVPTLNLFKQKKVKGWWPMAATDEATGEESLVVSFDMSIRFMRIKDACNSILFVILLWYCLISCLKGKSLFVCYSNFG